MKHLFAIIFAVFAYTFTIAQNYEIDANPTITDCDGFFMDSGGSNGNYSANESFISTICSNGTTGTHVRLDFSSVDLANGDIMCFYDGTTVDAATLLSCSDEFGGDPFIIQATAENMTGCITVEFTSNSAEQAGGWSAKITCIPSCQTIISEIISANPAIEPADTGWIDVCPGTRVFLSGKGNYPQNDIQYHHSDSTCIFEWSFGDGDIAYGPNATHIFDTPGGYIIQLFLTDQFGCRSSNLIKQRVRVATYPQFNIGQIPNQICAGDTINLAAIVNNNDSTFNIGVVPVEGSFQTEQARSDSLALPDGTGASYETSLIFTDFLPGQFLQNANEITGICVLMEHSWLRDLEITLSCPNGTEIILHDHPGNVGGQVFLGEPNDADGSFPTPGVGYEYCWNNNPEHNFTWIGYANAFSPPTLPIGSYATFNPISDLLGCPLNGEWTIHVQDLWGADNGFIFEWSIGFDPSLYPSLETFTPQIVNHTWLNNPSIFNHQIDSISASPINAGTASYVYQVTDDFGCVNDTVLNVTVLPSTHPNCHTCSGNILPLLDTTICSGQTVLLDASFVSDTTENVGFEAFPYYRLGFANHPANNPYASVLDISSILPSTISDSFDIVSICVDMDTDFDSDIRMAVRSPNGQQMDLFSNVGGGQDNFRNTCFVPTAITPITAGTAPFTGTYKPKGNWSSLIGATINGQWRLLVSDAFGINNYGTVKSWSITFRSRNNVIYTWSNAGTLSCNNCPMPTATPIATTNYIVQATDSYNCINRDTVTVTVVNAYPAPIITCESQNSGEILFSWNSIPNVTNYEVNVDNGGWVLSNGTTSHLVSGVPNGQTVTIRVRVSSGTNLCPVLEATQTCQFCLLSSTISNSVSPNCNNASNGSIIVQAQNAGANVMYSINGNAPQASNTFLNLASGIYNIVVYDGQSCTDTLTTTLMNPPLLQANLHADSVDCNGGNTGAITLSAQGGGENFTFSWSNGFTTANILNLTAGVYQVTITDALNCTLQESIEVFETAPITLDTLFSNALCFDGDEGFITALPEGGTSPYTYLWSDGQTQATAFDLSVGTYSVTVTDANNCIFSSQTYNIEQPTAIQSVIQQTTQGCFGQDANVALVTASNGTGTNYTYNWGNGQFLAQASNLPDGYAYVTVTDENNCHHVDSVLIQSLPQINSTQTLLPPSCFGFDDGQIAVQTVHGGVGNGSISDYNYVWSTTPIQTQSTATNLSGDQTYFLSITDAQGCQQTYILPLTQPRQITFSINTTDVLCSGGSTGTASVTDVQGDYNSFTFQWDAAAQNQVTSTAQNLNIGTYSVTITDSTACSVVGQATISQPPVFTIDTNIENANCNNSSTGSINLVVSGGVPQYQYHWSNGATTSSIGNLVSGNYLVTISDANNCQFIDTITIQQPPTLGAAPTATIETCPGTANAAIIVNPTGGTPPYRFSLDSINFNGVSNLVGLTAGMYNIYVQDNSGCTFSIPIEIPAPQAIGMTITPDTSLYYGDTIQLNISYFNNNGNVNIFWHEPYSGTLSCLDCANPLSYPTSTADYLVTIEDANGCETSERVRVMVLKREGIFVPTGFTPNGDGNNDLLLVHGLDDVNINLFRLYDRWGELIYQAENFKTNQTTLGWDGNFRGKPMPTDTYIWYLEAEYEDGRTEKQHGESTLIR